MLYVIFRMVLQYVPTVYFLSLFLFLLDVDVIKLTEALTVNIIAADLACMLTGLITM